jgi:MFS family permease
VIGAVDTAGWVVGHLYGGIITRFFDWRVIFWLNLPICLGAFLLILWALRGIRQERAPGGFDWIGALLISAALILASIGLGGGGGEIGGSAVSSGQSPRVIPGLILAAIPILLVFFWVEWRQTHPLVPLRLVREGNFAAACAANFLIGFSLIIAIANVPLFINTLVAHSLAQGAWDSGWMLSGLTVPMAFAALLGGWLTSRWGYRIPAGFGLLSAIAGFFLMSGWRPDTPYIEMLPHLALAGVGFGIVISPIATAVLEAASQAQRGVAAALVIILRLCGMTLGASAMTTYALRRTDDLMRMLLSGVTDAGRISQISMDILNRVISETFLIAAAACALAVLPILMLRIRKTSETIAAEPIGKERG